MITREMQPVTVITYTAGYDAYGYPSSTTSTTRTVDMVCKIYNQTNSTSPFYTEVEMIGITKDSDITESNHIEIDNVKYTVLKVIPSNRYYQVLMKRNK